MAIPAEQSSPFAPSGNLKRRKRVDLVMRASATFAALLAVAVLVAVIAAIAKNGISAINLDFFTKAPPVFFGTGGGILPEIVGTGIIVGLATAFALPIGMSKWRTTVGVVLPACLSGILTGTVLAVARAAGETAPLLLLSSFYNPNQPVTFNLFGRAIPNIPMEILNDSEAPDAASHARGWGAALVLVTIILLVSLVARYALARQRRKMHQ